MSVIAIKRTLHILHTCMRARVPRKANPGIGYQLQQVEPEDATEDYGEFESDFMSVNQSHRQHEAQLRSERDRVRQFMIKHKYFRDAKLPNLLLHAEKEQMRLLHERDPEEWSVERLAESFPATPEIVKKVLRAKWRPQNFQRIRAHDESVIRNWADMRAGKCDVNIPPALMEHLRKFGARKWADLKQMSPKQWPTRPELPMPQTNEFRALVSGGKQDSFTTSPAPQLTSGAPSSPVPPSAAEEETYLLDKVRIRKNMRLQELKDLVPHINQIDITEQAAQTLKNPSGTGKLPSFVDKFQTTEIAISAADQQRYEISRIKDRIVIPRKLHRNGATYRVKDAYYDDDGEFLYRVPGMTGSNPFT
ncbi:neugrin [Scaptodrosophila lebanonensis]|uniref:Neugrin n=1 Tax=Drosophila lebanonensis TaxID=7225 RepID=A0A6J2TGS7_DROLE|nr:neugrin [Scaptodrosophila lebanonensis]